MSRTCSILFLGINISYGASSAIWCLLCRVPDVLLDRFGLRWAAREDIRNNTTVLSSLSREMSVACCAGRYGASTVPTTSRPLLSFWSVVLDMWFLSSRLLHSCHYSSSYHICVLDKKEEQGKAKNQSSLSWPLPTNIQISLTFYGHSYLQGTVV